eukprot:jgi/Mesen1/5971/ME000302S04970
MATGILVTEEIRALAANCTSQDTMSVSDVGVLTTGGPDMNGKATEAVVNGNTTPKSSKLPVEDGFTGESLEEAGLKNGTKSLAPASSIAASDYASSIFGAGNKRMVLDDEYPQDGDAFKLWQTLLTDEQQKVFFSLRNEAAVIEETLRIQQQQVHYVREEADLLALNAKAERYLEEEQEIEHQGLLDTQNRQAEADSARQPVKRALSEHFVRVLQSEETHADLQKAYKLLELQHLKLQRARETFNIRMQQKEERHARERRELSAANARKARNMQLMLEMELANLPKDKREVALKVHKAEAGQMRVMQTKLAEQLRETQLLQQRNAQMAFEYDQNCKMTQYKMEASQLAQLQHVQQEHSLHLATLQREIKQKIYALKAQQKVELQKLVVSNLRKNQRHEAKRLRKQQHRDASARQEARRAGMEADFVEFLSFLQLSGLDSEKASSFTESLQSASSVSWEDDGMPCILEGEEAAHVTPLDKEDSETKLLTSQRKELSAKEEVLHNQVEQLRRKQAAIEGALAAEHMQNLRMLQRKHQQTGSDTSSELLRDGCSVLHLLLLGAANLQAKIEDETKTLRSAHASEKQVLQEEQDKAVANLKKAISLELQMTLMHEEHKRNLNDFLSFICHELRNPLCGISACLELIKLHPSSDDLDADIKKHVDIMAQQSMMMKVILNDVLDMRKIEEGKLEYVCVPLNLRSLMDEIVFAQRSYAAQLKTSVFSKTSSETSTRLLVDIGPDVPTTVQGDPTRLRQVMSNLLSNAVKFTPQGTVTIAARVLKQVDMGFLVLHFEVRDTGIGMSKRTVDRLFKKYQQAHADEQNLKTAGTGLGLAICKSLVTQMGGDIGVNSELGKGSSFWFTLPFGEEGSSSTAQEGEGGGEGPASNPTAAAKLHHLPSEAKSEDSKQPQRPAGSPGVTFALEPELAERRVEESVRQKGQRGGAWQQQQQVASNESNVPRSSASDSGLGTSPSGGVGPAPLLTRSKSAHGSRSQVAAKGEQPSPPSSPPVLFPLSRIRLHVDSAKRNSPAPWSGPSEDGQGLSHAHTHEKGSAASTSSNIGGGGGVGDSKALKQSIATSPTLAPSSSEGQQVAAAAPTTTTTTGMLRSGSSSSSSGGGGSSLSRVSSPRFPGHLRVLLAEDSPVLCSTGVAMLNRLGISADVAEDGERALFMCESKDYHLVILDVQMPKYTGDQVAKKLRQRGFGGAIVACTANAMPAQVSHYMASGMDDVLVKPYMMENLANIIRKRIPAHILEEKVVPRSDSSDSNRAT